MSDIIKGYLYKAGTSEYISPIDLTVTVEGYLLKISTKSSTGEDEKVLGATLIVPHGYEPTLGNWASILRSMKHIAADNLLHHQEFKSKHIRPGKGYNKVTIHARLNEVYLTLHGETTDLVIVTDHIASPAFYPSRGRSHNLFDVRAIPENPVRPMASVNREKLSLEVYYIDENMKTKKEKTYHIPFKEPLTDEVLRQLFVKKRFDFSSILPYFDLQCPTTDESLILKIVGGLHYLETADKKISAVSMYDDDNGFKQALLESLKTDSPFYDPTLLDIWVESGRWKFHYEFVKRFLDKGEVVQSID